jgi:hypothetical protein
MAPAHLNSPPIAKNRSKPVVSCDGKARFLTANQARKRAQNKQRAFVTAGTGPVEAYRCQFCGWYHLGGVHKHVAQKRGVFVRDEPVKPGVVR